MLCSTYTTYEEELQKALTKARNSSAYDYCTIKSLRKDNAELLEKVAKYNCLRAALKDFL